MKTLLSISSSPRRQGNSELLLENFTKGVEQEGWNISNVRVNSLKIRPCQACDRCAPNGQCIQQDDMQTIYPQVASATAIVLATPVYFGSMSAQLKMFIDRFQCWWHAKYNLNTPQVKTEEKRPGFFICVGALKNESYCESALAIAKVFFHNINYRYHDCIFFRGVDEKGAIKDYPDVLEKAFEAGRRFAQQIPG